MGQPLPCMGTEAQSLAYQPGLRNRRKQQEKTNVGCSHDATWKGRDGCGQCCACQAAKLK